MKHRLTMNHRLQITGILCVMLILALAGSAALAQESFLPSPIPPSGGFTPGQHQYAQTTPAYPTTPQYQATQQQASPYPTTQYQTSQQQTSPYTTTQQPLISQQQRNQYPTTQYQTAWNHSAGASPAAKAANDGSNQIQQTRYIEPSMPGTTSPFSQTAPHSASYPSYPTLNAPQNTPQNALPTSSAATTNSSDSIEGQTVADVRIIGNKSVKKARISAMLHTRKDRPYSNELIQRDVRELSRSGLFVNVRPSYQETSNGPIVIFEVIERPTLDSIKFVGAKAIKRKVLLKESALVEGDPADPFKVEEARRSLEYFYHEKGYGQAKVTVKKGNKPGDREAIFVINEGSKKKILWTKFEGNTVASDARLRTQIESKQGILWFINGEFNREKIEADKEKLTAYYRGLGFFKARIGAEVTFPFDNWATVTFVVDEGPRYKVRETRFIGNEIYREGQLMKDLKMLSGEYFNQTKMTADIRAIQERYGRVGYVFADVKAEPRFLEEPGMLDLVYNVKEGDQYRVGPVNIKIKGDGEISRTRHTVILDRLSLAPGDIIDIQKIRDSERRIRASQVFSTNPTQGGVPKILFSPPEDLGEEEMARGPHQSRGQNW